MNFETYIAKRYFRSGGAFTSVATWITIAGVALGVAVVCFVMSMHNGFESEIRSRLLGTTSHISVFPASGDLITNYDHLVAQIEEVPGVVAASPFIYYKAAISSASAGDGIIVRGIDPELERNTADIAKSIVFGNYTLSPVFENNDTLPTMLMGKNLAERLGVAVGTPVVLYSLKGEDLRKNTRPRIAKFILSGIFETGMYEFDAEMAYISIPAAQDLFRLGDAVTGVHMKLTDMNQAQELTPILDQKLGFTYDVVPWNVLHRNLFTWIAIEKKILFLGFILIVIVAAFSIISTLVMLTMEKRAEIGILKTMGATPGCIRKIFVYKGLGIGAVGVLAGWVVALGAAYLQNRYELITLPADIYFIKYLPIDIHLFDFLLAGALTILICFGAALYPSHQAARVSVIDVLRQ
jgi:lipoprotein-releasing system permease protein